MSPSLTSCVVRFQGTPFHTHVRVSSCRVLLLFQWNNVMQYRKVMKFPHHQRPIPSCCRHQAVTERGRESEKRSLPLLLLHLPLPINLLIIYVHGEKKLPIFLVCTGIFFLFSCYMICFPSGSNLHTNSHSHVPYVSLPVFVVCECVPGSLAQ